MLGDGGDVGGEGDFVRVGWVSVPCKSREMSRTSIARPLTRDLIISRNAQRRADQEQMKSSYAFDCHFFVDRRRVP